MSSRRNFLDADNNIMERNLRFVQNDLEDNLNQYFGGSGSRGNSTAISAPPRDYKVVQPKPVESLIPITSIGLDARKEFLRQIGLARHEAYDLAKEKNFDVKYYREKREEWRKFGDKQQADTRILLEIKRANYKRSDGGNVAAEPAANFQRKSFTRNYVRSTEITIAEAPPPPIISNIQIEQYQTATERYTINKEITTNYAAAFEHVFNNTLKRPSTEEPKTIYISDSEADTDSQRCLNKNNTLQESATETTPYVKMSSGEKRKFKRALAEGRTREEALQLVGPKKPRFESNKIYQKLSTQDIINCDTDTQTYPQSSVINSSQKSPIYVPFVKLTSTEKRRFKRALDEGLTREVAIALVKTTKPYETKRALSVVPFVKLSQPSATTQAISSKPSHSQIPNNIKIGLVSQDINRPLTSRQIEILQESIIDTTIEFGNYAKPEFNGCHPRKGWLMINCVNKITADWVKAHIETIMEKSNCSLKVVDESEFPRSHYIRGYLPHSQDLSNEKVLATIASQNGLDSKDWKIVMRKTEDSLLHLIMVVDDSSWSKLKELNGRIAYRFGHVKLMLKNVNAKEQVVQTAAATDGNELEHYVLPLDEGPSTSRAAMVNFIKRPTHKYACGDRSPKRSYDLGLARHEVYKRDNSWDQRINVERNRISNTQREKSFSNYIPPAPRKIQWNNESDISAPKRRHSPSPQRNANIYEHDKRSRFSHRDGEQNNRKFSRSPTMNYMQQQTQNRQSRSPRRNDDDYLGTKSRFQDSERYSSRYSPPFSSRQRQLRSPLRNEERPTGSNLAREIARNATRSSLSPVRNFSYMPTRETNYQRSPERDDYRSDQPTSSSSLNTKERNATGLSPKYFRHSPSPLRDNYRSYTATSSVSQNSRAINPFRSSPSPSRDLNFKRERERNYRHRYSRSPPPPKKMPKKILRLLKFKELRKERRAILQESGVDVLAIYRAEREQKRIKKGLLPNKQEKKKQKPKIPRKVAKFQAFSKRTAYNKVMKNGMNKFLESKANREIFFMKPVKGHLKGSPKEYWTIWWSSLKYIESAIPNINPEDMDVKPVINFLLEPGTGAYAHRKRILLKMGVSTSTRFFDRISEEDYATWDMFRLMQYIKHLEDDKFQNNLSPFEVERAKMAITPWRQDKRKSALLHQALICMWHFPMRGYKHLEKEDRIRKIQNHIVLGNKAFHYMVAESVQILKKLCQEDWPEFEEFYDQLDEEEFDKSVFVFLKQENSNDNCSATDDEDQD